MGAESLRLRQNGVIVIQIVSDTPEGAWQGMSPYFKKHIQDGPVVLEYLVEGHWKTSHFKKKDC